MNTPEWDCQVGGWREDPYEADVNNNPGVLVWCCPTCDHESARDI